MKLAISCEIPLSEFWEMTPYELNLSAESYWNRRKEDYKEKLSLSYYNSMWTIQWLGKRQDHPKPLQEILDSLYKEKKMMTDEQMLTQVKVLNTLFGGELNTCNL